MRQETAVQRTEVIVVGGGMVGTTLTALLGEAGVSVVRIDAREAPIETETAGRGSPALRVSALTPVSQRLLSHLGVWPRMAGRRVTPYHRMLVWDGEGSGRIRFSADEAGVECLGHIVENDVTLAALEACVADMPNVHSCFGHRVTALETSGERQYVTLDDDRCLSAPLVVAADGAGSPLREMAGIDNKVHETGHHALVTSVRTERPHGGMARQVFLAGGPLAFLPLTVDDVPSYCSIVWSTTPDEAAHLQSLSPSALGDALARDSDACLGQVQVIDRVVSFPLAQRHARQYVKPGFALVGDAAHSLHPLAGQGVNLGLMDAAVLAEELLDARRRGAALSDPRILSRYERRRRPDNTAMLALMDGFRLLFGTRQPTLRLARNLGLSSVDRFTSLKRLLMHQATGERGRLPRTCR
ncbi:2-octaprenyl-3-methyl-6-methoxy-1,4-benzoquinol hydroxylase [Aidingimonas halophila]|uniref:2-octaprenyl-3-methyl-6-methoxy-1,4-benzoquinol hydroxylase n=2 Tax=Aidingimonas halophila TaxID=574349 RepID=A0A1H2XUC5_9GAMM|nr:UbiH/UbiF/VisC/COQ6 family ubiquinone biosynthesis hydroxylase [Aidingimonas halophila]SDW96188.1 2-octaprenyl-3-methyl-6-methoxy-1,4-benzoquinol hydroxylase [Aidingimonas halophila]